MTPIKVKGIWGQGELAQERSLCISLRRASKVLLCENSLRLYVVITAIAQMILGPTCPSKIHSCKNKLHCCFALGNGKFSRIGWGDSFHAHPIGDSFHPSLNSPQKLWNWASLKNLQKKLTPSSEEAVAYSPPSEKISKCSSILNKK